MEARIEKSKPQSENATTQAGPAALPSMTTALFQSATPTSFHRK
jgi:hypothetical protein